MLTTDILIGFPGETEEDFRLTLELMEQVRFDDAFTYRYNPRAGTRAFLLPDDVPGGVKQERLAEVIRLQRLISAGRRRERLGREVQRAGGGAAEEAAGSCWPAPRATRPWSFPAPPDRIGHFARVRLLALAGHTFRGEADLVRRAARWALPLLALLPALLWAQEAERAGRAPAPGRCPGRRGGGRRRPRRCTGNGCGPTTPRKPSPRCCCGPWTPPPRRPMRCGCWPSSPRACGTRRSRRPAWSARRPSCGCPAGPRRPWPFRSACRRLPARLVERAGLSLELGLTAEAEQILQRSRGSEDAAAAADARLLLAAVYLATGRGAQGEAGVARTAGEPGRMAPAAPAALLALGEALRERGDAEAAGEVAGATCRPAFPLHPRRPW